MFSENSRANTIGRQQKVPTNSEHAETLVAPEADQTVAQLNCLLGANCCYCRARFSRLVSNFYPLFLGPLVGGHWAASSHKQRRCGRGSAAAAAAASSSKSSNSSQRNRRISAKATISCHQTRATISIAGAPQDLSPRSTIRKLKLPNVWSCIVAPAQLLLLLLLASAACIGGLQEAPTQRVGANNWQMLPIAGESKFATPVGQAHDQVPYKTFYVSQACEWKSNLFVPKSNDILFAQSAPGNTGATSTTLNGAAQLQQASLSYDAAAAAAAAAERRQQQPVGQLMLLPTIARRRARRQPRQASSQPTGGHDERTTAGGIIMSTSSKALVLALWPTRPAASSTSSNGFEQACSIRLIVPRNMRILAKLSARKLTFTEEHLQQVLVTGDESDQRRPELTRALWLNVSLAEFSETEHRTLETEGNVLAFRFLLERFAAKQVPEMRFQVVLTAFQTLGENEGLNLNAPTGSNPFASSGDNLNQNAQFICDSQRLISANLACDGYKNCQDGHDEEPASCLVHSSGAHDQAATLKPGTQQVEQKNSNENNDEANLVWRTLKRLQLSESGGHSSPLVGFLLGFLLVLLILACCSCCLYCFLVLWRRHLARALTHEADTSAASRRRHQQRKPLSQANIGSTTVAGGSSSHLLAAERQNLENAARLRAIQEASSGGSRTRAIQGPTGQLQSILKKAPLARFERLPNTGNDEAAHLDKASQLAELEQATGEAPAPPPRRGALASSLTSATGRRRFVAPTPAQRRSRHQAQGGEAEATTRAQQLDQSAPKVEASSLKSSFGQTLSYSTQATRIEQSSSTRRNIGGGQQRLTSYVYSEDTAQYSESYLVARGNAAALATQSRDYANLSAADSQPAGTTLEQQQQQRDQKQSRQSSLI